MGISWTSVQVQQFETNLRAAVPRVELREAVHDLVTIDHLLDYEAAVIQLLTSERSYAIAWMQISGAGAAGAVIGLATLAGAPESTRGQLFWVAVGGVLLLLLVSAAWGVWMLWDATRFRRRLPEAIEAVKVLRPS